MSFAIIPSFAQWSFYGVGLPNPPTPNPVAHMRELFNGVVGIGPFSAPIPVFEPKRLLHLHSFNVIEPAQTIPALLRLQTQVNNYGSNNVNQFGETGVEFLSGSTLNGGAGYWCVGKIMGIFTGHGIIDTGTPLFQPSSPEGANIDLRGGLAFFCSPSSQSSLPNENSAIEVMRVIDNKVGVKTNFPLGQLDVNVGIGTEEAKHQRAKISLTSGTTIADPTYQPQIRLYSPSGVSWTPTDRETSYSWYIQSLRQYNSMCFAGLDGVIHNDNNTTQGALHFRAGYNPATPAPGDLYSSDMGTENTVARMSLLSNGNVGINNEVPMVRFTVNNGAVLFEGEQGATPLKREYHTMGAYYSAEEIGVGTRLMWIPNKAAFRAGKIDTTQGAGQPKHTHRWDNINIGTNSIGLGKNTYAPFIGSIAIGDGAMAGDTVAVSGTHGCIAIGHDVISNGHDAISMGYLCKATGQYSGALGYNCKTDTSYAFAMGYSCSARGFSSFSTGYGNIASGHYSLALSSLSTASGINSIAIGTEAQANKLYSISIGRKLNSTEQGSLTIGEYLASIHKYGFVIGRGINDSKKLKSADSNSLSIGFLSDSATLYIGPGADTTGSLGKVGIGTTKPANRLDIKGGVVIGSGVSYSGSAVAPSNGLIIEGKTIIGGLTSDSTSMLTVNGDGFYMGGTGSGWTTSDSTLKKDIASFKEGLSTIKQIQPVRFHFNGKLGIDSSSEHIGILAQDIQKIAPYTVKKSAFMTKKQVKSSRIIEIGHLDSTAHVTIDSCNGQENKTISYTYEYNSQRKYEPEVIEEEKSTYLAYNPSALAYLSVNAIKELDSSLSSTVIQVHTFDSISQSIQKFNTTLLNDNILLNQLIKVLEEDNIVIKQRVKDLEEKIQQIQTTCCKNTDLYDDVLLEQNVPNPFSKETIITYFVPERLSGRIELVIADASGNTILQSIPIQTNIPSQYTYSASDLQTGVYLYGISLNGQIIKSKKMILIK